MKSPTMKGAIVKESGAAKVVVPAGRFELGHLESLTLLGTHIGNPE